MIILDAAKVIEFGRQQAEYERMKKTLKMVDSVCNQPWWSGFRLSKVRTILKFRG